MRFTIRATVLSVAVAVPMVCAMPVAAQTRPWDIYVDPLSDSACDVVNAANAELVVLSDTGQLVIVSGDDVVLQDTVVDLDGLVSFEGSPAGLIDFAEDDDGFRTLWWMSLTGRVVEVDEFTGEPTPTDLFPGDIGNVPCDACPFWDDPAVCGLPDEDPDIPPISVDLCGMNTQFSLGLTAVGLTFMGLVRRRSF